MKNAIRIALASALITAAAIKAAPALAEPIAAEQNISFVRTADLDLRSGAGLRQLDERLAQAAREVCGEASNVDLAGKNAIRLCRDETIARAKAETRQLVAAANRGAFIAVTAAR